MLYVDLPAVTTGRMEFIHEEASVSETPPTYLRMTRNNLFHRLVVDKYPEHALGNASDKFETAAL